MAQATYNFPAGFIWGTATSSHQVEGNNTNNQWWAWEQQPNHILHGHKSGLACDWWGGRWREDFDRAAETNQNALRLSIEWSRIQPTPDRWDENALDRYRQMLRGLHERNMIPMVTLHHFSDPIWLTEAGGWEENSVVGRFEAYTRRVVEALQEYVDLWITINEPNVYAFLGFLFAEYPPGKENLLSVGRVLKNMVRAHSAAYRAIHSLQPAARVGVAHHYRGVLPAHNWSPLDRFLVGLQDRYFNDAFPRALDDGILRGPFRRLRIPEARGTQDFFGLNNYTREYAGFDLLKPKELFYHRYFDPEAKLSCCGALANEPKGFFEALQWSLKFKLPIIVTENGVEDADDLMRPHYLIEHLYQLWRAVNFSWPVKGYFHWSLIDNFEWDRGWTQRFGLWGLDVDTQARIRRRSVDLYAEICRENALSSDLVARYTPELVPLLFPP